MHDDVMAAPGQVEGHGAAKTMGTAGDKSPQHSHPFPQMQGAVPMTGRPQWPQVARVRGGGAGGPRRNLVIKLPTIERTSIKARNITTILIMLQPVLRPNRAFFDRLQRVFGQVEAKA